MAGYLTTHVLDTAEGRPAAGMRITLWALDGGTRRELAQVTTNSDGRTDGPILPEGRFATGRYAVSYKHLTQPTIRQLCRYRWWP